MQGIGHFFIRVAGVALLHGRKTLAGVGKMRGGFGGHFSGQAAVFGELWRHSERVEILVLWNCRFCGRHSTSDASGSFFVAGAVLCRPQRKSSWDLGQRSFLTVSIIFHVHFSWCAQFFVKSETCARRATFSALSACQIALVAARCEFCHGSRRPGSLWLWLGADLICFS